MAIIKNVRINCLFIEGDASMNSYQEVILQTLRLKGIAILSCASQFFACLYDIGGAEWTSRTNIIKRNVDDRILSITADCANGSNRDAAVAQGRIQVMLHVEMALDEQMAGAISLDLVNAILEFVGSPQLYKDNPTTHKGPIRKEIPYRSDTSAHRLDSIVFDKAPSESMMENDAFMEAPAHFPVELICGASVALGYHHCNTPIERTLELLSSSAERKSRVYETINQWIYTDGVCAYGFDIQHFKSSLWGRIRCFWRLCQNGTLIVTAPLEIAGYSGSVRLSMEDGFLVRSTGTFVVGLTEDVCSSNYIAQHIVAKKDKSLLSQISVQVNSLELEQPWVNKSTIDLSWDFPALVGLTLNHVLIGKGVNIGIIGFARAGLQIPCVIKRFDVDPSNTSLIVDNAGLYGFDSNSRKWLIQGQYDFKKIAEDAFGVCSDAKIDFGDSLIIPHNIRELGTNAIRISVGGSLKQELIFETPYVYAKNAFMILRHKRFTDSLYEKEFFQLVLPSNFDFGKVNSILIRAYSGRCPHCGGKINLFRKCSKCGKKAYEIPYVNVYYLAYQDRL